MQTFPNSDPVGLGADVLAPYELFGNGDYDMVRKGTSEVFSYPGTIEPVGALSESIPSMLRAVELTHMTIGVIRFGTETRIRSGPLRAYNLTIALNGELLAFLGSHKLTASSGAAVVATVDNGVLIPNWSPDAEMLVIKVSSSSLERELETMIGRPIASSVHLAPNLDLGSPAARSWLSVLRLLLLELSDDASLVCMSRGHREQLERMLMSCLLRAHSHDYAEEVRRETDPPRWASVKRAVEAIDAAPEDVWTLPQLAQIAGVGERRLQQGFHAQLGTSPIAYVRDVRLDRARRDLAADAGSVSEISTRWGFTHLGRFAAAYRARFGEPPSQTRRRGRSIIS